MKRRDFLKVGGGAAGGAARREKRIEKAVGAMRDHMWDEKAGTLLAVNRLGAPAWQTPLPAPRRSSC
jgi:hypothetical protein